MRRTEFDRLVSDEFGSSFAAWIGDSHILSTMGDSAHNLIEQGYDLRDVWEGLCDDFNVPAPRRLGQDIKGH